LSGGGPTVGFKRVPAPQDDQDQTAAAGGGANAAQPAGGDPNNAVNAAISSALSAEFQSATQST